MTEKEFRKLKRDDLLGLLLEESRENTELSGQIRRLREENNGLREAASRLQKQLRQKDQELSSVLERMEKKDSELDELRRSIEALKEKRTLRIENAADDMSELALRFRDVFETAKKTADLYLAHIEVLEAANAKRTAGTGDPGSESH